MLSCPVSELVLIWLFSIEVACTLPVERARLRRLETGNAVLQEVCFSMLTDTPSHPGPVDLLVSIADNRSYTDSSVALDNFLVADRKLRQWGNYN